MKRRGRRTNMGGGRTTTNWKVLKLAGSIVDEGAFGALVTYSLIDPLLNDEIDNVTVVRIVGDIFIMPGTEETPVGTGVVGLCIYRAPVNAGFQLELSPFSAGDMDNEDVMWWKHLAFGPANGPQLPTNPMLTVDIRTKRILRPDSSVLLLSMQSQQEFMHSVQLKGLFMQSPKKR